MSAKANTDSVDPDQHAMGDRPVFPAQFRETRAKLGSEVKLNSGRDGVRPLQAASGTRKLARKYYRA
jgi:hypothetical protein